MSATAFLIVYFAIGTLMYYRDVKARHLEWDFVEAKLNELPMWAYLLIMVIILLMVLFLWVPSTLLGLIKGGKNE